MSSADRVRQDHPGTRYPPLQPMAPTSDLGMVIPPVDPLGLPEPPPQETKPIRRDDKQQHAKRRHKAIGMLTIVALILGVVAVALLVVMGG